MMKKLLFCFLAAALVLTSCSKDDSLPLPEVSKVEIIGATEGQMKITTGQTVGFSVECENVAIDRYEWIVNEKIESESVRFDFTPAQRGTYDISVNLYNADGGVTTKQIGELQVVDPAPVIASISCNDEALSDPVEVAVGNSCQADRRGIERRSSELRMDDRRRHGRDRYRRDAGHSGLRPERIAGRYRFGRQSGRDRVGRLGVYGQFQRSLQERVMDIRLDCRRTGLFRSERRRNVLRG